MKSKIILISGLGLLFSSFALADGYYQPKSQPAADSARPTVHESNVAFYPESRWGQPPAAVTKELVYLQHPELMPNEESNSDLDDTELASESTN